MTPLGRSLPQIHTPLPGPKTSALVDALERVWAAATALPDDEASFTSLSPEQRRAAHDSGARCQDRLVRVLARLVEGMATDGVELVDDRGVPSDYSEPSGS